MASPKAKSGAGSSVGRRGNGEGQSLAFFLATGSATVPKGTAGFKIKVPAGASKVMAGKPARVQALLQQYGQAIAKSRDAGRTVSFRVDVDPEGEMVVSSVEEGAASAAIPSDDSEPFDSDLEGALIAARVRGRIRAAEILAGEEMMSAEDFAKLLGTTRVTINTKRQSGQVLGLDGAKRGFRFPEWQLDAEGKPYAMLPTLHERLGGAWAVYRFLVQPHGELDGLTGREALERARSDKVLEAAESIGRDFR